ncbi:hypothetical protein M5K25_025446 [Dendrobium thyrsiflorum]|uniref:Protein TIFY n=1 Tax=Dendrobium thyrsiflorum TaxID=117978 RepID=A0ABD0U4A8_DENTH
MERDFLGVGGRNSRAFVMEDNLGGRLDSAFSVSSAVHWPFLNRTSALQKFMSFETSGEDKRKKLLVEQLSSTGLQPAASVDAFSTSNTVYSVNSTEKSFGKERHGVTQFSIQASQNQQPFASIIASNASLGKNVVGAFTPRNAQKPHMKSPQLTIFYAGSVNVYDDVPSHMAQAIMLTASRECKTAISSEHPRSDASVLSSLCKGMISNGLNITTQTLNNTVNHLQHSCSEIKTGIEAGLADDKTGGKSIVDLILTSKNEPAKTIDTIIPRAVPQARKASLARFLQKRKERVSNVMPYSFEKKSPDSCIVLEGAPTSSKFSSTDASISSNRCGSWLAGQTKSCSDSDESLSTKLEM